MFWLFSLKVPRKGEREKLHPNIFYKRVNKGHTSRSHPVSAWGSVVAVLFTSILIWSSPQSHPLCYITPYKQGFSVRRKPFFFFFCFSFPTSGSWHPFLSIYPPCLKHFWCIFYFMSYVSKLLLTHRYSDITIYGRLYICPHYKMINWALYVFIKGNNTKISPKSCLTKDD